MAAWVWLAALLCGSQAAVLPPPWADVKRNPCAALPRGWLMLYWPKDGKCYTIYKVSKLLFFLCLHQTAYCIVALLHRGRVPVRCHNMSSTKKYY